MEFIVINEIEIKEKEANEIREKMKTDLEGWLKFIKFDEDHEIKIVNMLKINDLYLALIEESKEYLNKVLKKECKVTEFSDAFMDKISEITERHKKMIGFFDEFKTEVDETMEKINETKPKEETNEEMFGNMFDLIDMGYYLKYKSSYLDNYKNVIKFQKLVLNYLQIKIDKEIEQIKNHS